MINLDFLNISLWWFVFFLLGLAGIPLMFTLFGKFFDAGYGISKTFGVVCLSFIFFVLSSLKLLPITRPSIALVLLFYIIANTAVFFKRKTEILKFLRGKIKIILLTEGLFLLGLFGWAFVRAHQPDIRGLEKFMDYGFINSLLRSRYLPPVDMWFSGQSINYYWFGHLITAVLTKLTGINPAVTYNLMLGTILGLTLTSVFSLATSLLAAERTKKKLKTIITAGLLTAFLLALGGNFHTPFYGIKDGFAKYWYPDATRFIGYNPDTNDKTIHEFPSYSFIVADLHAHLLDLPVVLMFMALLASLIVFREEGRKDLVKILALGVVLGVMFATSTWDFGIYLLLATIAIALSNLWTKRLGFDFIYSTSKTILMIMLLGLLSALPFILHFSSIAEGVGLVSARTPVWQLAILWGFPALLTFSFFVYIILKKALSQSEIFVFSLIATSWILIILPEIIYVKDIYIGSYHRANTMFKLTYQAFVMFYLSSGFIIVSILSTIKKPLIKIGIALIASVTVSSLLIYPYFGIKSFYGGLKNYRSLNGESWLLQEYPATYQALIWLRKNTEGQPVILEAPGDSYTDYNVLSAYSGLPTVSGWFVHEWLWRGSAHVPQSRVAEISTIYLSQNRQEAEELLKKYGVSYIVVGQFEKEKWPNLSEKKFEEIGRVVFSSGGTKIYQIIKYN